jgi:hypothetical protein
MRAGYSASSASPITRTNFGLAKTRHDLARFARHAARRRVGDSSPPREPFPRWGHYVYALTDYREVDRSIALARLG